MLAQTNKPAAHVGEDRPSNQVFWSVTGQDFAAASLSDLIRENNWLRPGDFVYQAQATGRRVLSGEDFTQAAAANAPARDPRVPDMFEVKP